MTRAQTKSPLINGLWDSIRRRLFFFHRLQWKLTVAYTLFTVVTILILGGLALALLWYLNFRSNSLPGKIADALIRAGPTIAPYLEQTPPDQAGLSKWLQRVTLDNNLVINIPREDAGNNEDRIPAQFGRVVTVAIVDTQGRVLAITPAKAIKIGETFEPQVPPTALDGYQAALNGETDVSLLSTRDPDGYMVATAPIFGADKRLLGAIFVRLAFPIEEGEFVQLVLQGTILPVALGMLLAGVVAGILFGFLIARGLTRRLKVLAGAADAWSQGDLSILVRDNSGDELGQLARHFNQMAIQLQNLFQTHQELATLEERNRLARELHDSVKQQVFATAMQVGATRALLEQSPEAAKSNLAEAERLVRQAQQELTSLIKELRPAALEGKGLARALRDYVADWSRQNNIAAEVRVRGEQPLPLGLEQALFRVAQEALANVARHSGAATAEVYLGWEGDEVILTISDDGRGFNMAATDGKGMGLQSMRERVEGLGGHLIVENRPAGGTQVTARLTRVK